MDGNVVTVERTIQATPERIFAMLADATRHPAFDGSGTVRSVSGPDAGRQPLRKGSVFGMSMRNGLSYSTLNTVVEYEQDARIAWQTTGAGLLRHVIGGRIWRYELKTVQDKLIKRSSMPASTKQNMTRTLERWRRRSPMDDARRCGR